MMDVTSYGKPFPCKMIIRNNHMPPAFLKNFKNHILFGLNLAEAVKRQIIFARKTILSIHMILSLDHCMLIHSSVTPNS